jgi:predicted RNase H-like HicB family nuclease
MGSLKMADELQLTDEQLDSIVHALRPGTATAGTMTWHPSPEQLEDWRQGSGAAGLRRMVDEHLSQCEQCAIILEAAFGVEEDRAQERAPEVRLPDALPEPRVKWFDVEGIYVSLQKTEDAGWFASCPAFDAGIEAATQQEALQTLAEVVAEHCRELADYEGPIAGAVAEHKGALDRLVRAREDWVDAFETKLTVLAQSLTVAAAVATLAGIRALFASRRCWAFPAAVHAAEEGWQRELEFGPPGLKVTLWETESGEVEANFETRDAAWEGTLVLFSLRWSDADEWQEGYAPLQWDDQYRGHVASLRLGQGSASVEFQVASAPVSPLSITSESIGLIEWSYRNAASPADREAWRRLLADNEGSLPGEVVATLSKLVAGSP